MITQQQNRCTCYSFPKLLTSIIPDNNSILGWNKVKVLKLYGSFGLTSLPKDYFQDTKDLFKHKLNQYNYLQFKIRLIYPRGISPNYPRNMCRTRFATVINISHFSSTRWSLKTAYYNWGEMFKILKDPPLRFSTSKVNVIRNKNERNYYCFDYKLSYKL